MPGPNPRDLTLIYNATATGVGIGIIGDGTTLQRYASGQGNVNQNGGAMYYEIHCRVTDSTTGAVAVIQFQDAPNTGSAPSFTTRYTLTLTVPSAAPFYKSRKVVFRTLNPWVQLNVSSLTGGTAPVVNAYCTYGGLGQ
ncbi:MAG: hypothetical protein ACRDHP_19355 [Ktedonobacterales bacterium]